MNGVGEIKRFLLLFITICLMVLLSACTGISGTPTQSNEKNMIINIKNNSHFDFYGLEAKILNHTLGTVNADGSIVEKGQKLRFEFSEEDFELEGEAEMEFFILADTNTEVEGDRVPINKKMTLELASNKEISLELTGDSIQGADINLGK